MADTDDISNAVAQLRALLQETIADLAQRAYAPPDVAANRPTPLFFPAGIGKISAKISLAPAPSVEIEIAASDGGHAAIAAPNKRMAHPIFVHNDGDAITLSNHDTSTGVYGPDFVVPAHRGTIVDADPGP